MSFASPRRLQGGNVGQVFRVDMCHVSHPNGDYQVANKVQVLDLAELVSPGR
ncbi:hypothetical protein ACWC9R_25155 [Streptomyces sp. NPDC001219]